jgi:hypothetical protein
MLRLISYFFIIYYCRNILYEPLYIDIVDSDQNRKKREVLFCESYSIIPITVEYIFSLLWNLIKAKSIEDPLYYCHKDMFIISRVLSREYNIIPAYCSIKLIEISMYPIYGIGVCYRDSHLYVSNDATKCLFTIKVNWVSNEEHKILCRLDNSTATDYVISSSQYPFTMDIIGELYNDQYYQEFENKKIKNIYISYELFIGSYLLNHEITNIDDINLVYHITIFNQKYAAKPMKN